MPKFTKSSDEYLGESEESLLTPEKHMTAWPPHLGMLAASGTPKFIRN